MKNIFLLLFAILISNISSAVSFNCNKASNSTEHAICSDNKIGNLDDQLSSLYKKIRKKGHGSEEVKKTQRIWLKERNRCGSNTDCLIRSYNNRIKVLRNKLYNTSYWKTSFDCNKASKQVEFTICNSESLSKIDKKLGEKYAQLMSELSSNNKIKLKKEQRLWIKQRDLACSPTDIECLSYQENHRRLELSRKLELLRNNTTTIPSYKPAYVSKSCGKKPALACSPNERANKAFGMCALVMGGCEAALRNINSVEKRYAAGQACGAVVSELSGQQYDVNAALNNFVVDTLSEAARSARNSDNGFVQFFLGISLTVTEVAAKAQQLDQCTSEAGQHCTYVYNKWQNQCNN